MSADTFRSRCTEYFKTHPWGGVLVAVLLSCGIIAGAIYNYATRSYGWLLTDIPFVILTPFLLYGTITEALSSSRR